MGCMDNWVAGNGVSEIKPSPLPRPIHQLADILGLAGKPKRLLRDVDEALAVKGFHRYPWCTE